jgi:hypothetical protein
MASPFDYGIGQGAQLPANSSWQSPGQPQQNIPLDNLNGFSFAPAGVPFWDELLNTLDPSNAAISPWDQVSFAGQILPGIALVTTKRGNRYDVKKAKGRSFATITVQGFDPAEVKVLVKLWTRQQLNAWASILPVLISPSKTNADGTLNALDIYHPALALMNVGAVVIRSVSALKPSPVRGIWESDIECLEYKPVKAKNDTATVKGAINITIAGVSAPSQAQPPPAPVLPSTSPSFTGPGGATAK